MGNGISVGGGMEIEMKKKRVEEMNVMMEVVQFYDVDWEKSWREDVNMTRHPSDIEPSGLGRHET